MKRFEWIVREALRKGIVTVGESIALYAALELMGVEITPAMAEKYGRILIPVTIALHTDIPEKDE